MAAATSAGVGSFRNTSTLPPLATTSTPLEAECLKGADQDVRRVNRADDPKRVVAGNSPKSG